jgi:hypothetical protein
MGLKVVRNWQFEIEVQKKIDNWRPDLLIFTLNDGTADAL